jgi:WD40 repeat protein
LEGPTASIIKPALAQTSRIATVAANGSELYVHDLSGTCLQVYRHTQPISVVAISPDGERVAFADNTPAVWLWEIGTGRPRELSRLSGICKCLAFAPDGGSIAVSVAARTLLLDTDRGKSLAVLSGHEKEVRVLDFSRYGRLLASSAWDGTIRIWEVASGRERHCLWIPRTVWNPIALSPDGKTLASGSSSGEVILWNVAGGQELMRLDYHKGGIFTLAFSPDGKILAAGGYGEGYRTAEVTLWYSDGARPRLEP